MIIIEGVDATGKSTLAEHLARYNDRKTVIQESEGPAKSLDEMMARVERYRQLEEEAEQGGREIIFVRHPLVSEPLYANFVHRREPHVSPEAVSQLYDRRPLIIYCEPPGFPVHHVLKSTDTPEFLAKLEEGKARLLLGYRQWALSRANVIYRIGDDILQIARLCV